MSAWGPSFPEPVAVSGEDKGLGGVYPGGDNLLFGEEETALEARLGPAELARKGFLRYYLCPVLCCSALSSSPPGTRLYSL